MAPRITGGDIPIIIEPNNAEEDREQVIVDEEEAFNHFLIVKIDQVYRIQVRSKDVMK